MAPNMIIECHIILVLIGIWIVFTAGHMAGWIKRNRDSQLTERQLDAARKIIMEYQRK